MLLDELQQHVPERYFSHYIHPNLLSAVYAASGRKMGSEQHPSERLTYDDDEQSRREGRADNGFGSDQPRRQKLFDKHHIEAEEIDDNLDYGTIDD